LEVLDRGQEGQFSGPRHIGKTILVLDKYRKLA